MTVILDSRGDFNLQTLRRVARDAECVEFSAHARERIEASRTAFLKLLENNPEKRIYGVTTGFGDSASEQLDAPARLELARSAAPIEGVGFGSRLPPHVVRSLIFARLTNFVSGHSAVSLGTAQRVADMLDGRPLPVVPRFGQDSFGELAQQYNLYHQLHGDEAEPKDANVLTNGSPCAAGLAGDVALDARTRVSIATKAFALAVEAGNMPLEPYDPMWKQLFGDAHESRVIEELQLLCDGARTQDRRSFQAPVSWRILVRVLGIGYRCVHEVEQAAATSLCAVTDNPVFIPPDENHADGYTLQSGGFHDCLAYHSMGWLNTAWVDLTVLATRQIEQLQQSTVTGLPQNLTASGTEPRTKYLATSSLNSSLDALEHASPTTIPLGGGGGQTDIIMPVFRAYNKACKVGENFDICMASLAAVASQALWIGKREPAPPLRPFLDVVREHFPPLDTTRNLGAELEGLILALKRTTGT